MRPPIVFLTALLGLFTSSLEAEEQLLRVTSIAVKCFGDASGLLQISVDSIDHFTVTISDSANKILNQYASENQQPFVLDHLKAGKYRVELFAPNNKKEIQEVQIESPSEFKANMISLYSIDDQGTYTLKANPSGGTEPYSFKWSANSGNQTCELASHIKEGTYTCVMEDQNGCGPKTVTFFLYAPEIDKYKQQTVSNK